MRNSRWAGFMIFLALLPNMMGQQSATAAANIATVPRLINYSGVLKDSSGRTLTTIQGVTFLLYKEEQGGAPLWLETQNILPDKTGHYSVQLGAATANGIPADLFVSGEARWLAVQLAGEQEQARVLLVAVPYAMKAEDAQTLGGLPPSAFMLAGSAATSTNSTTISNSSSSPTSTALPPASSNVTTTGGTANTIPLFTTATNIQNSILSQTGTTAINVGGKLNLPATGTATAAAGKSSQPQDFVASVFNSGTKTAVPQTFQLQAEPAGNNTATASGTLNLLYGSGTGAPAETGLKINNKGQITFASGQTFPGTGPGTVKSVASGAGLTGGPITSTGTLSIANAGVTNAMLANPSLTIKPGTGLTGGGVVALGGSSTLNIDTTQVPTLSTALNTFAGSMIVNGSFNSNSYGYFPGLGIGTTKPYTNLHLSQNASGGLGPVLTLMNSGGGTGASTSIDFDTYDPTPSNFPGARIWSVDDGNYSDSLAFLTKIPGAATNFMTEQVRIADYGSLVVDSSGNNALTLSAGSAGGTGLIFGGTGSGEGIASCRISASGCLNTWQHQYGLDFYTNHKLQMSIVNSGAVVFSYDTYVYGCTTWSNGNQQGTCLSDARLKTNIQPFPNVLDKLTQLRPVHFDWKSSAPSELHLGSGPQYGFIAQDVEKVFPEMVSTGKDGYRRVNYGQLPYLLLQGVRELKATNDSLGAEVRRQRKQNQQARAEIAKLHRGAAETAARLNRLDRSSAAKDAQIAAMHSEIDQLRKAQQQMAVLLARFATSVGNMEKLQTSEVRSAGNSLLPRDAAVERVGFGQ
jgi:Chaperone of endosialidase